VGNATPEEELLTNLRLPPATAGPIEGHREVTACHVGFVENLWKASITNSPWT